MCKRIGKRNLWIKMKLIINLKRFQQNISMCINKSFMFSHEIYLHQIFVTKMEFLSRFNCAVYSIYIL